MPAKLELRLLGGFSAQAGGRPIHLKARKDRALLAFLALSPGRRHQREQLANLFWGSLEADSRHNLRQSLLTLARSLGVARVLQVGREDVAIDAGGARVDALRVQPLLQSGSLSKLEAASTEYAGALLAGLGPVSPAFDDWLTLERGRLAAAALAGHRRLVELYTAAGAPERAIAAVSRLVAADPLQEDARRELILLHADCGHFQTAIEQYEAYAKLLREELGAAPTEATRHLYRLLVDGEVPARRGVRPALPARMPPADRATDGLLQRYAFVLEQMPDCVVVTDVEGRIVGWNRWARQSFGYERREVLGRKPVFLYGPGADEAVTTGLIAKAIRNGRWSGVLRLFHKDGSSRLHKRTMMPLRDESGRIVGVFGVTRPLTRPIPGL